ncbi:MAG: hypothetical protein MMC33_009832 [Icmadophila ericetorum]|nr:hypothetical protein [Icmadophila ericetorum]
MERAREESMETKKNFDGESSAAGFGIWWPWPRPSSIDNIPRVDMDGLDAEHIPQLARFRLYCATALIVLLIGMLLGSIPNPECLQKISFIDSNIADATSNTTVCRYRFGPLIYKCSPEITTSSTDRAFHRFVEIHDHFQVTFNATFSLMPIEHDLDRAQDYIDSTSLILFRTEIPRQADLNIVYSKLSNDVSVTTRKSREFVCGVKSVLGFTSMQLSYLWREAEDFRCKRKTEAKTSGIFGLFSRDRRSSRVGWIYHQHIEKLHIDIAKLVELGKDLLQHLESLAVDTLHIGQINEQSKGDLLRQLDKLKPWIYVGGYYQEQLALDRKLKLLRTISLADKQTLHSLRSAVDNISHLEQEVKNLKLAFDSIREADLEPSLQLDVLGDAVSRLMTYGSYYQERHRHAIAQKRDAKLVT